MVDFDGSRLKSPIIVKVVFLIINNLKDDYEIGAIKNKTSATTKSVILDVGCGTGHHVDKLAQYDLNVIGIDKSPSMIAKAKYNYPSYNFILGDVLDFSSFTNNKTTSIFPAKGIFSSQF